MTLVEWVIIAVFILVLGTTVFAVLNGHESVSNTLQRWAIKGSWFGCLFGTLCGHWFIPNLPNHIVSWPAALAVCAGIGLLDVINNNWYKFPNWFRHPIVWFSIGLINGAALWGSNA